MSKRADLLALASVIETADPLQQAQLLCHAWDLLARSGWADADKGVRFMRCIEVEAFESAAIMLVPEEAFPTLEIMELRCWLRNTIKSDSAVRSVGGSGNTIAYALAAACLRARAQEELSDGQTGLC